MEIMELFEETKEDILELQEKCYYTGKEECYLETGKEVPLIRFRAFDPYFPKINAAFSTRFGGVSKKEELSELNLGFDRGEPEENVVENYKKVCRSMGENPEKLVLSDQIHHVEILPVGEKDTVGKVIKKTLKGIDGLITREDVILATSYADCVPLLFADPVKEVIAASHSGWRGTVGKIGAKTAGLFVEKYGSRKEDIIVVIGPSICQNCYEVSEDVILEFQKNYTKEQMKEIAEESTVRKGKYQLDLWAANYLQLKEAGLLPEHIHVSGICTCMHSKLLFSHRASHGKRGNLNAFIALHHSAS